MPRLEVDQVMEVTVPLRSFPPVISLRFPSTHETFLAAGKQLQRVSESFREHLEQNKFSALLDLERKIFLTLLDLCVSSW